MRNAKPSTQICHCHARDGIDNRNMKFIYDSFSISKVSEYYFIYPLDLRFIKNMNFGLKKKHLNADYFSGERNII